MANFPKPIQLPETVSRTRTERKKELIRSSTRGVFIRLTIIAVELFGVFLFGSAALLMDALASFLDVAFSLFLIFCIRLAAKPPDKNHPFGHGRYEPLMGMLLGLLLALIGGSMLYQQGFALTDHETKEIMSPYAWIIPFFAVIMLEICYRFLMRSAKRQNSPALAADALHYRIDGVTSFFAAIALGLAAYIPEWSLFMDHLGAIAIAALMIGLGLTAARKNMNQLLDRVPDKEFFTTVRESALKVKGVAETEKIRIQLYGPDAHVDIDVEVDPKMSVSDAHEISQKVRAEIQKNWPAVRDVTVHIEPYYPNDHMTKG